MTTTVIANDLVDGILDFAATVSAAADTVGETLDFDVFQSLSVQIGAGFTGTWVFEVTNDPTGTWLSKTLVSSTNSAASTGTAAGLYSGDIGARYFRVRFSALSVGTPRVDIVAFKESQANVSPAPSSQAVTLAASATNSPSKAEDAVHASGDVGMFMLGVRSDAPSVDTSAAGDYGAQKLDRHGAALIRPIDTLKRTYAAAAVFTPVAGIIFEISGVASPAVIEINRITLTLVGTAAGYCGFNVSKNSAIATGGTPVAMTKVPYDSADAAAGAVVRYFTAAPTAGTAVGQIRQGMLAVPAANTPSDRLRIESGSYSKSFTLLSAAETITIALTGTLPTGAQIALDIEWTQF